MSRIPVINLNYLEELSGGDTEFLQESIDMAKMIIPKRLSKLEAAYLKADHEELYQVAHKMKSTARMVGMPIYEQLEEIEAAARKQQAIAFFTPLVQHITKVGNEAMEHLSQIT